MEVKMNTCTVNPEPLDKLKELLYTSIIMKYIKQELSFLYTGGKPCSRPGS
jgi:hypothetical protein